MANSGRPTVPRPKGYVRCLKPWPSSDASLRIWSGPLTEVPTFPRSLAKTPPEATARPNPKASATGLFLTGVPSCGAPSGPGFFFKWPASKVPSAAAAASTDQVTKFFHNKPPGARLFFGQARAPPPRPAPPLLLVDVRSSSSYRRREPGVLKADRVGASTFPGD